MNQLNKLDNLNRLQINIECIKQDSIKILQRRLDQDFIKIESILNQFYFNFEFKGLLRDILRFCIRFESSLN